ncbi:MAG TPA: purine-nucleoside phosphorylase [Gemmatimonadales bacterium]|jgi:purine-nucleoside phosphorylase|nr:purine-nucleoside phosphorylase [Gemmatimonadales bacterium]
MKTAERAKTTERAGGERAEQVEVAAAALRKRLGGRRPKIAIVLGSGLGFITEHIEDAVRIPYREISGFPATTVIGHGAELVAGRLAGKEVLVQSGRFHLYEGHDANVTALPVRAFATLGIDTLLLTNAAGGIRRTFSSGTVMLIADHINLTFRNPLTGPVLPGEERFPDMSDPYDASLRAVAREVARERRIAMDEGVYVQLLGPSYETPAEIRMLDRLGADAVGMSTVVEVIAARARGVRCLGFSVITNLAAGISPHKLGHAEVMETAHRVRHELAGLVEGVIERF